MGKGISIRPERLRRKLVVVYATASLIPILFLCFVSFSLLRKFNNPEVNAEAMKTTLTVGLVGALMLSVSGLSIIYPSIRSIENVTREAESFIQKSGRKPFELTSDGDEAERISGYFSQMMDDFKKKLNDIEEHTQKLDSANQKLLNRAVRDGLTGLHNRTYAVERLTAELRSAGEENRQVSVIMMDLDNFKKYNDTLGHVEGDQALKKIAQAIRGGVRAADIPARYGGEEFLVILPSTDESGALVAAEKIRRSVENTGLTASLGVSTYPDGALSTKELIELADQHLYEAKRAGKNRVFHQPSVRFDKAERKAASLAVVA